MRITGMSISGKNKLQIRYTPLHKIHNPINELHMVALTNGSSNSAMVEA